MEIDCLTIGVSLLKPLKKLVVNVSKFLDRKQSKTFEVAIEFRCMIQIRVVGGKRPTLCSVNELLIG